MPRDTRLSLPPLLDDLDTAVVVHDPDTAAILAVNERATVLYGFERRALLEQDVEAFSANSTSFTQAQARERIRTAAAGDPQSFEWQIERSNGELRWVDVHLVPSTVDGVPCVVAEVRDVTSHRARERRLHLLNRVVRHNLRNDMTILEGHAERLRQALEANDLESEVDVILDIASDVGELSESIGQIEEIVEPDATERETRDLRALVETVVDDVRSTYDATFDVDGDESVFVTADRGVEYALQHALDNAVVHNDDDPSTVTVTVDVIDDESDQAGVVRVRDTCPPIPAVEIDVLDEEAETSSTYHGSGVGLWVMKWCVESLGGELSFAANDPRGNVVSLALPRADSAPSP
jgi:PAS domain S-box-containing protein